ncbi:MAG: hypothetical protein U0168_10450 [Nannocystaceae bacterium]
MSIPVKLFTSVSPSAASINNLHKDRGTRLKYQFHCPKHDAMVGRETRSRATSSPRASM